MRNRFKKGKQKVTYAGIELDSEEELEFYHWCLEAEEHGFIEKFYYHPEPFLLSTKDEIEFEVPGKKKMLKKTQHMVSQHVYTPDFLIKPTDKFNNLNISLNARTQLKPHPLFKEWNGWYYIDTKAMFNSHGGDAILSINQRWVWQIFRIYVNKVVPIKWFKATWVPQFARYTKVRKDVRSCYKGFKTINEVK